METGVPPPVATRLPAAAPPEPTRVLAGAPGFGHQLNCLQPPTAGHHLRNERFCEKVDLLPRFGFGQLNLPEVPAAESS